MEVGFRDVYEGVLLGSVPPCVRGRTEAGLGGGRS